MRRILSLFFMTATFALAGCQSHDAKIVDLQKEYDRLSKIYIQDCPGPGPTDIPKPQSPKCQNEDKQQREAYEKLQAARVQK
jgi:Prokaryotic membrane lipoprotein lipid attachment site